MLLAVRISSYGCTWKVWRALALNHRLGQLLRFFRALQTSRVLHNSIVQAKAWTNCLLINDYAFKQRSDYFSFKY